MISGGDPGRSRKYPVPEPEPRAAERGPLISSLYRRLEKYARSENI